MPDAEFAETLAEIERRFGVPEYHEPEYDPVLWPHASKWRTMEPPNAIPVYGQQQLFALPTLEDQAEALLPKLARKYKRESAQIKNLAKVLQISESRARRVYRAALDRYMRRAQWIHYQRNRAWYEFLKSAQFCQYVEAWMDAVDRRCAERDREFNEAIAQGREHVIAVGEADAEIRGRLSNGDAALWRYHGPMQRWIDLYRVTPADVQALLDASVLRLVEGNPETLIIGHTWPGPDEPDARCEPAVPVDVGPERCADCGAELTHNVVSLNVKLGYHPPRCLKCLDLTEEEAEGIIRYYRDSGCTMFV